MAYSIPKNSATAAERRVPFVLVDATDLITPEDISVTGVKVSLSFGGGTAANSTNDIVKVDGATGRYYVELTQAEANTAIGAVHGYLKPTGCAACYPEAEIVLDIATLLGTPAASVSADIAAANTKAADIQSRLPAALVSGRLEAYVGAMATDVLTSAAAAASFITEVQNGLMTAGAYTAPPSSDTIRDAIFARTFSAKMGSLTFEQIFALGMCTLLGKVSGLESGGTPTFRNLADDADAIAAENDNDGNRTDVTLTAASVV